MERYLKKRVILEIELFFLLTNLYHVYIQNKSIPRFDKIYIYSFINLDILTIIFTHISIISYGFLSINFPYYSVTFNSKELINKFQWHILLFIIYY